MQNDLVEVLENYATSYGWQFSYGNKANQNLLQSDLIADKIYLLLDPLNRKRKFSEFGGTGKVIFTGSFLLVVKSTIDLTYHGQGDAQGKYLKNIKPLLQTSLPLLEDDLNCSAYEIENWDIIDVVDAFDVNTDGIIVKFTLSIL